MGFGLEKLSSLSQWPNSLKKLTFNKPFLAQTIILKMDEIGSFK